MLRHLQFYIQNIKDFNVILVLLFLTQFYGVNAQTNRRDSLTQKLKIFRATSNYEKDTLYINLLYELGLQSSIYNLDSLRILAKETIELSQSINYEKGELQGLMNLGSYYSEKGDHNKAIEGFKKALAKATEINHLDYLFRSKNLLAIEYEYNDDFAKALSEYLEGIEIAKKNNSYSYLSTFYVNASNLYSDQGEFEQVIYFLNLAKENNKKIKDNRVKGLTLANLAASYIEIDDLETATQYANESVVLFEDLGLEYWQMYAYELKATIFYKQKQLAKALLWFGKSEKIHESIDQPRYKIPLYNGIAKTYFDLKDFAISESYAKKALVISKSISLLDERDESLQLLYKIKKQTDEPYAAIEYLEELKALTDTLNKVKNVKELRVLKSKLAFDQEKERYILENEKRVNQQKSYFYASLFIILTAIIIIFILRRNNTIQNQLNTKLSKKSTELEKKEVYLENSNNTKSRLFSIIAHDLKGPINSFKSMFDLVKSGDMNIKDFMNFVPKMSENINHISFTLNNLLSWGQSQMDGMITKPEVTSIKSIVDTNIALLSKSANQKSILIESKIDGETMVWSDKNQISIVIRNMISNAIKFTPSKGLITIGANEQNKFWEIWIKDTGVGLSIESLDKIFHKKESFTTYGTNNEKGTGLGLLLCKEMVEKNNGELRAESILNKGTCFYFTVPKVLKTLKKVSYSYGTTIKKELI